MVSGKAAPKGPLFYFSAFNLNIKPLSKMDPPKIYFISAGILKKYRKISDQIQNLIIV